MVYGSIVITLDNVLLPKEKLTPTPSSIDGLDEETEKDLRISGCELIQTSGILLKLPQTAMATGQVIFQRYYFSKSLVRQAMETTAMACIYLASKIEESPRRIRDVINVFHHIRQFRSKKKLQPLILDQAYIRLKSDVTLAERRILKELGFCVHVKHPHKLIVIYIQQLGFGKETKFIQRAWNYMNDALRTSVFVSHTPEAIACACIFLSSRFLNIGLPDDWYGIFDISETELLQICCEVMDLYERPIINYDEMEKKVEVLVKAYQESRQKLRIGDKLSVPSTDTNQTSSPSSNTNPTPENMSSNKSLSTKQQTTNNETTSSANTTHKTAGAAPEKNSNGALKTKTDGLNQQHSPEILSEKKIIRKLKEELSKEREELEKADRKKIRDRDVGGDFKRKKDSRDYEYDRVRDRSRGDDRVDDYDGRDREFDGGSRRKEEKRRRDKDIRRERDRSKEKRRRYY